jgi:hypothetical protein
VVERARTPRYGWEIPAALQSLTLFEDPYLMMQAQNLAIVDGFLNALEQRVMKRLFVEDRIPVDDAMFLNGAVADVDFRRL